MGFHQKLAFAMMAVFFTAMASTTVVAVDLTATEITSANGRVEVKKTVDPSFKKLHSNLKLAGAMKRLDGGDKLRTYENSTAEMALKETCILAVKEQSIFEVPLTLGQTAIQQLTAQQGTILLKVVGGSNFQVQTADVIAGVKGTLFELEIFDNLTSLLETPALQIGTVTAGATRVNVYKGEVELTHKVTGQKRNLKGGESLAALSPELMAVDKLFGEGFTPKSLFNPISELTKKYSESYRALLDINNSLSAISGLNPLGNFDSKITSNVGDVAAGLGGNIQKQFARLGGDSLRSTYDSAKGYYQDVKDAADAFGPGYNADFSKFNKESRSFMVTDSRYKEIYLGGKAFAACKAGAGSKSAKIEPNEEGIQLIEGNAMFRVCRFNNADTDIEFLASHHLNGNQFITTVNVLKGELYGRIPGSLEHFRIPAGSTSFVYEIDTGKGSWTKASKGSIDDSLNGYSFSVVQKLAEEKKRHDKQSTEKKKDVGLKVLKKLKLW